MALLAIAAGWADARGRELLAVTVDHGLRIESAAEAGFVADFSARIGVAHRTLKAVEMARGNLSAAARDARYSLMAEWAAERGVAAIALGHSMDDQAETLLMRLARGSGVEGLSAMTARRDWRRVAWIRPMLAIRRADLRSWLQAEGIPWIDDPTNEDPAFDRVKARRALSLLEPLGITVEGLARTTQVLARQRRVLARAAADLEALAVQHGEFGEACLSPSAFAEAEYDTALRVFGNVLARAAGREHRPRARVLEPAFARLFGRSFPDWEGDIGASGADESDDDAAAGAGEAPSAMTLGGCLVLPAAGGAGDESILICREPGAVAGPVPLDAETVIWDGRWLITAPSLPEGEWLVGALGPQGCAHLRHAEADGVWNPPETWASAARKVRETVAAIFPAADISMPAAVPAANFLDRAAPPKLADITAEISRLPIKLPT